MIGQIVALLALSQLAHVSAVELDSTYWVLIRAGESRPHPSNGKTVTLGAVIDKLGRPILDSEGAAVYADNPDFTSYRKTPKGLFSVVQMETAPAPYFAMGLSQDKAGHMRVDTLQHINISKWEGSIRPCAGSVTPWSTHMGGEESCPDVRAMTKWLDTKDYNSTANSEDVMHILNWHGYYLGSGDAMNDGYLKGNASLIGATFIPRTQAGLIQWFDLFKTIYKPYMIGHIFEIDTKPSVPSFGKHMALGRSSFETGLVMPDMKTVYLTDDASSGGLLKFVAAKKWDLTRGTLYAAKFKQTSPVNGSSPRFTVTWIKLADMDAAVVEAAARKPLTEMNFGKIFLSVPFNNVSCPSGYKRIDWTATECLKLNTATPNVAMLAAGLESRRMIPFMGATTEFTKMEGLTLDTVRHKLYMAISYQRGGMAAGVPAAPAQDDIRIALNPCGCTYALDLDTKYSATNMYPEVCGQEVTVNGTKVCSLQYPANVDNLDMMKGYPWLAISEDSDREPQDFLWAHNVVTKQNVIVGSAEMDAEVTAGHFSKINKYTYLNANYQGIEGAPIGYLGPFDLNGVKEVTWKAHVPPGPEYKNPNAPYKA